MGIVHESINIKTNIYYLQIRGFDLGFSWDETKVMKNYRKFQVCTALCTDILSKLIDSIIRNTLLSKLDLKGGLYDRQFGYRKSNIRENGTH